MIETNYVNNVIFNKIDNKKITSNKAINLYYKTSIACVKLGMGKMYDDHCASSLYLDKITYNNILTPFKNKGIEILSDIDKEIFRKDITMNIFIDGRYEGSFIATKEDLEKLFVVKKQLWTEHGFADWISCIPAFSPYDFAKFPQIFVKDLKTIWNIPEEFKFYEEGDYESGIEATDYLELGWKKKRFAFIDNKKLEIKIKEKEKKVLQAKEYEEWMDELKYNPSVSKEVKEKIKELYYLKNKNFIDKEMLKFIEDTKNIPLYKLEKTDYPYKEAAWYSKYSPYSKEYQKAVNEYKELYDNLMIVETKAGSFLVDKRDKVWNVEVPDKLKGLFIGKEGRNIKELAKEYNVKIIIKDSKNDKPKFKNDKENSIEVTKINKIKR